MNWYSILVLLLTTPIYSPASARSPAAAPPSLLYWRLGSSSSLVPLTSSYRTHIPRARPWLDLALLFLPVMVTSLLWRRGWETKNDEEKLYSITMSVFMGGLLIRV